MKSLMGLLLALSIYSCNHPPQIHTDKGRIKLFKEITGAKDMILTEQINDTTVVYHIPDSLFIDSIGLFYMATYHSELIKGYVYENKLKSLKVLFLGKGSRKLEFNCGGKGCQTSIKYREDDIRSFTTVSTIDKKTYSPFEFAAALVEHASPSILSIDLETENMIACEVMLPVTMKEDERSIEISNVSKIILNYIVPLIHDINRLKIACYLDKNDGRTPDFLKDYMFAIKN
jgi:hypothetical protein